MVRAGPPREVAFHRELLGDQVSTGGSLPVGPRVGATCGVGTGSRSDTVVCGQLYARGSLPVGWVALRRGGLTCESEAGLAAPL